MSYLASQAAIASYIDGLVRECANNAVLTTIRKHCGPYAESGPENWEDSVPRTSRIEVLVANAPLQLLQRTAVELLLPSCKICDNRGDCHIGHINDMSPCAEYAGKHPPFGVAYYDGDHVRHYVLVSGQCTICDGHGHSTYGTPVLTCPTCKGKGFRVNVGEIARRYGGTGDAEVAYFTRTW